jgi:hypothetical protein
MVRWSWAVVLAVVLSGCKPVPPAPAPGASVQLGPAVTAPPSPVRDQVAFRPVFACLLHEAGVHDNQTADPAAVARKIEPLCARRWETYVGVVTKGMPAEEAASTRRYMETRGLEDQAATAAVNLERSRRGNGA